MAAKSKTEDMSIEEAFKAVDARIKELEKDDISLEDSFKYYKEGMDLLKFCNDAIDKVEKKVQKIAGDGNLEDFE
ncbi:MAG: exodeoxyribonuclease VII small subunit [Butyrivibrio sp.]|nr:exodeoxyribonuclease VII small subunit [Butyrivibrio sp.]